MSTGHRRSELLSLLSEACEVEHALACSYLFAAFSLEHGALPWQQQQRARLWAAQVYFVASQEMLHLAQVWNLLTAVGGTPYYGRPPFPIDRAYFPVDAPITLERYGHDSLERFVRWEQPAQVRPERAARAVVRFEGEAGSYASVGELYARIEEIFAAPEAPALFIGAREHQVGADVVDFPELRKVLGADDAIAAVRAIRRQGEGSPADLDDCHFGVFVDLQAALADVGFQPARDVVANPTTRPGPGTLVTDPGAVAAMALFDDVYVLMLRMLGWTFGPVDSAQPLAARFARAALLAMVVVLKPLGEGLTRLGSGHVGGGAAGASFRIGRHVPLPREADVVRILVSERWDELCDAARRLVADHPEVARGVPGLVTRLESIRREL